jgi:hypothetical protein
MEYFFNLEKIIMRKAKVISPIILPILLIVGLLAIQGHAAKPGSPPGQSKPEPVPVNISVIGAIEGQGNPEEIGIEFVDASFGSLAFSYVANPDYPPALKVSGNNRHKRLSYYYCDNDSHSSTDGICGDKRHDPSNYKNLRISGGIYDKNTQQVAFAAGSSWRITQKVIDPITKEVTGKLVAEGTLETKATYEVLEWSTP